ncbi:hypothetical protein Caci_4314 [Catenulispora acidiphila DSM 44928]|uniref:Uncharacterized protein n=1 Tax=Catenulispora acidiphila (strain DSM 44928 / JCM 14897 / NBRC 102108 / NRRL B-24433 / ID139908) TaxID=479433 RepID=C7QJU0_CATAD|nr:hypothetical protein [Catenulispora acidiphila]ACU73178.1 hypothetical protein Caci_4314 [Catenulispora acidiphila DSM 44928]
MTPKGFDSAESHDQANVLPDALTILTRTSWGDLEHAQGSAGDIPAGLRRFLDDGITARTHAVAKYLEVVNHQNSIYSATTSVALYVAAHLADQRTAALEIICQDGQLRPLRAVLIDWLGLIADDVSDEMLAVGLGHGFQELPAEMRLRSARSAIFQVVVSYVNDPLVIVRTAAVTSALLLLDTPEERRRHQARLAPGVHGVLEQSDDRYHRACALDSLDIWGVDTRQLRADEPSRPYSPRLPRAWATYGGDVDDLPLWLVFRTAVADRFQTVPRGPQAASLFTDRMHLGRDDRGFWRDFSNDILHQDTCGPHTADGVPLLAAIAAADRVPPRHRFDAVELLVDIATVTERHEAECWPDPPPHADFLSEPEARVAVHAHVPELLARWGSECPAVQMALAALAVTFRTERTYPALAARLQRSVDQYPAGTDIGDYVRLILVLASGDDRETLDAVESFTDAYWRGTPREAPLRGRALHLLRQMLVKAKPSVPMTTAS